MKNAGIPEVTPHVAARFRKRGNVIFLSHSIDRDMPGLYNNCRYITVIIINGEGSRVPPRTRITRDMIIDAAIEVAEQCGYEGINARTVSGRLHCSTQLVDRPHHRDRKSVV